MSRPIITLAPDVSPDRQRRCMLPIASLFVTAPLLAPIIFDAVALSYAQWCELLGAPIVVRTPTLDTIGDRLAEAREELLYHFSSFFHRVPWNPRIVLPVAVAIMILAALMLRL